MHPILIKIGLVTLYSYGFFLALAFLFSTIVGRNEAKRKRLDPDIVYDLVIWAAIGGIIGARLFYAAYNWELFYLNPLEALAFWKPGLVFYGGLAGGFTSVIGVIYFKNLPVKKVADIAGLSLPLGLAFGRVGCFLNGCCYGHFTSLPWGVIFPSLGNLPRHPTQIYELFYAFAIFVFLWLVRSKIKEDGALFAIFIFLYSLARFLNEFLRENPDFVLGLSGSQVISVILFLISLIYLSFLFYKKKLV